MSKNGDLDLASCGGLLDQARGIGWAVSNDAPAGGASLLFSRVGFAADRSQAVVILGIGTGGGKGLHIPLWFVIEPTTKHWVQKEPGGW